MLNPRHALLLLVALLCCGMLIPPAHAQEDDAALDDSPTVHIGIYSDSDAFNNYWRVKQYNEAIKIAQPAYQRLHQNGEKEKAEALRGILAQLKKDVNANFDKDLDKVLQDVMDMENLDVIMRGKIIKKEKHVKVTDITTLVTVKIGIKPKDAADPFEKLREMGKEPAGEASTSNQEALKVAKPVTLALDSKTPNHVLINDASYSLTKAQEVLVAHYQNTSAKNRQITILQGEGQTMSQLNTLIQLARKNKAKISFKKVESE